MSKWQPIESAPKDGTEVILAIPVPREGVTLVKVGFFLRKGGWKAAYGAGGLFDWSRGDANPSHWMPLPEPPEEQ